MAQEASDWEGKVASDGKAREASDWKGAFGGGNWIYCIFVICPRRKIGWGASGRYGFSDSPGELRGDTWDILYFVISPNKVNLDMLITRKMKRHISSRRLDGEIGILY